MEGLRRLDNDITIRVGCLPGCHTLMASASFCSSLMLIGVKFGSILTFVPTHAQSNSQLCASLH